MKMQLIKSLRVYLPRAILRKEFTTLNVCVQKKNSQKGTI